MEHGGGNNSTFTTRVVTSSGSDTYSRHRGGSLLPERPEARRRQHQVVRMMNDIQEHVGDTADEGEIRSSSKK